MHNLFVKILIIIMAYFLSISITYSDDKTMQKISNFLIDKTEVTIGEFKVYAKETLFISLAERNGGGNLLICTIIIPPSSILLNAFFINEIIKIYELIGLMIITTGLIILDGRIINFIKNKFI